MKGGCEVERGGLGRRAMFWTHLSIRYSAFKWRFEVFVALANCWHFRRGTQWKQIVVFSSITLTLEGQTIPAASVESLWAQRAPLIATCWCTQVKGLINVRYVDSPSPPMATCTGECWLSPGSLEKDYSIGGCFITLEGLAGWLKALNVAENVGCLWCTSTAWQTIMTRVLKVWGEVRTEKGFLAYHALPRVVPKYCSFFGFIGIIILTNGMDFSQRTKIAKLYRKLLSL